MRRLLLLIVFVLMLIASLFAFTPLGFVLGQSGAGALGIGWAKADGTLMKGRISGLYAGSQPIGDVNLVLRPASLLALRPAYDVQWSGAGGQGTAILTLSRGAIEGDEIRMRQEISALEGLDPAVRAMGGQINVEDAAFRLTQTGCERASGRLSSNTLSTLAAQYGRQFGEIAGPIRCETGDLLLTMDGTSNNDDRVTINASAGLTGQGEFSAHVKTQDAQIIIALEQIGFERENSEFVYRQSRSEGDQ